MGMVDGIFVNIQREKHALRINTILLSGLAEEEKRIQRR